jgi:hypothetical protein
MLEDKFPQRSEEVLFKKANVFVMVILSYITFGIYVPYWFLSRRKAFEQLSSDSKLPYRGVKFLLFMYIIMLLLLVTGPMFLTEYGLELKDSIDYILTMYGFGIVLYSVFRAKEMINDHYDLNVIKPVPAAFFHIWYLQYKLNQLSKDKVTE